jgi:DNA repair protein RadC
MGSRSASDRELLALCSHGGSVGPADGLRGYDPRSTLGPDIRSSARDMELRATAQSRASYLASVLARLGAANPADTAQGVIERFGSLAAFAGADIEQLEHALPHLPCLPPALVAAQAIALAGIRERALTTQVATDDPAFLQYLRLRLAKRQSEILLGFFLSRDAVLLCERTLAESEGHSVNISAAAILRGAIAVGAASVLLVHNHPSGIARPSKADRAAMNNLVARAKAVDINIVDHLIVAGGTIFSMKRGQPLC